MTDTINEQISSLVDGELPSEECELLRHRLAQDSELRATWRNYHLIRDAIRGGLPKFISTSAEVDDFWHQVPDSPYPASRFDVLQRFNRPFIGMVIAASVAMLAVISVVYNDEQLADPLSPQIATAFQTTEQQRIRENFVIVPRSGWQSAKPAVVSHLNGYLVDHSHYAGFGSAPGIISYSRVAGYDKFSPEKELQQNAR